MSRSRARSGAIVGEAGWGLEQEVDDDLALSSRPSAVDSAAAGEPGPGSARLAVDAVVAERERHRGGPVVVGEDSRDRPLDEAEGGGDDLHRCPGVDRGSIGAEGQVDRGVLDGRRRDQLAAADREFDRAGPALGAIATCEARTSGQVPGARISTSARRRTNGDASRGRDPPELDGGLSHGRSPVGGGATTVAMRPGDLSNDYSFARDIVQTRCVEELPLIGRGALVERVVEHWS